MAVKASFLLSLDDSVASSAISSNTLPSTWAAGYGNVDQTAGLIIDGPGTKYQLSAKSFHAQQAKHEAKLYKLIQSDGKFPAVLHRTHCMETTSVQIDRTVR